ncbi:MAG: addiction module protein [Cellulomonas sp.]|jgi:putative addiction module component (TIGR02574 family)|nr:addiction module protein [Cellulomonas sp.]
MTTGIEEITQAALTLGERERAALAATLLGSLDNPVGDPAEVETAWTDEIRSRVDDIVSGRVKTIPLAQVKAEVAERRAAKPRSR